MKTFKHLGLALAFAAACATPSFAQDYMVSTSPLGFTSINPALGGSGTEITGTQFGSSDDGEFNLTLPFTFNYFGQSFTGGTAIARIGVNGAILLSQTSITTPIDFRNTALSVAQNPASTFDPFAPSNGIYVAWDDLGIGTSSRSPQLGKVFQQVLGTTPNQMLIIEYSRLSQSSSGSPTSTTTNIDAQLVLFESGAIEFRYSPTNNFGTGGVTTGLKGPAPSNLLRGFPDTNDNQPTPASNVVFTPFAGNIDLNVSGSTVTPNNNVQVNDTITVSTTVSNIGFVNSTSFDVGVYLSIDSTIDTSDQLIGMLATGIQLDFGNNMALSGSFSLPSPNPALPSGRRYFVGIIADPTGSQNEPFLNDNSSASPIFVGILYSVSTAPTSLVSILTDPNVVIAYDATVSGSVHDLEVSIPQGTPFAFNYCGTSIAAGVPANISSEGYLELNQGAPGASVFSNTGLPNSAAPNAFITPMWDDSTTSSLGKLASLVSGTMPNRTWTVEWNRISRSSYSYIMQVLISEATGVITFKYQPVTSGATSVFSGTIGLEDSQGADAVTVDITGSPASVSNVSALPAVDIIFTPPGVAPPAAVDLTPTAISVAQASANAATMIDVTRTVMNAGTSDAMMPFQVSIYLSTDSTITTADTLLGTDTIASLGAGMSATATSSFLIPTATAAGNYFVGIIVNTGQSPITESNSMNNSLATTGTVMISVPGKAQGNINGDSSIDIADVMACITVALATDSNSAANVLLADVNGDNDVNILDIQITVNRVLAAP